MSTLVILVAVAAIAFGSLSPFRPSISFFDFRSAQTSVGPRIEFCIRNDGFSPVWYRESDRQTFVSVFEGHATDSRRLSEDTKYVWLPTAETFRRSTWKWPTRPTVRWVELRPGEQIPIRKLVDSTDQPIRASSA